MIISPWTVDSLKILTRRELAKVLESLGQPSASGRMNRVIFRLACCCGLRVSEIGVCGSVMLWVGFPDNTCGSVLKVPKVRSFASFRSGGMPAHSPS